MGLILICDIDGTVADTIERVNMIIKKFNIADRCWGEEEINEFTRPEYIKTDELIGESKKLPELARRCKAKLIFLTGRSNRSRNATRIWLKNKLDIFDSVPLLMRDENDFSDPEVCKKKIFTDVVLKMYSDASFIFFDDDEKALKMYSEFGIALKAPECWNNIRFFMGDEND